MAFVPLASPEKLHTRVTRELARQVLLADDARDPLHFPKEADLSRQLGVSRTVLRESMKVLADKGMVEMKPRAGTRARPRSAWRLLDPDILAWQAEMQPSSGFLRHLCEVRLAIEPTAAGFAAVRASKDEIAALEACLAARAATAPDDIDRVIRLDLEFHAAMVAASGNPLLAKLSDIIRAPIRIALSCTSRYPATLELGLEAHRALLGALRRRDPVAARRAADEVVGLAMLAVEKAIRSRDLPEGANPGGESK